MKNHWRERNGAEITTKSFQKYCENVLFRRYRPPLHLPCLQSSICLLLNIWSVPLYAFRSTQLLIGIFAIRCWMHTNNNFSSVLLAWLRLYVIFYLRHSNFPILYLSSTANDKQNVKKKRNTVSWMQNEQQTLATTLADACTYTAVCFIVPNASFEFIISLPKASTRCTRNRRCWCSDRKWRCVYIWQRIVNERCRKISHFITDT